MAAAQSIFRHCHCLQSYHDVVRTFVGTRYIVSVWCGEKCVQGGVCGVFAVESRRPRRPARISRKNRHSSSSFSSLFLSSKSEISEYSPLVFAKLAKLKKSGIFPDSHFQHFQRNEGRSCTQPAGSDSHMYLLTRS